MSAQPLDPAALYAAEHRQLLGVAYRLLGTMSDAEDVLQDVFERWIRTDRDEIDNPAAYLTTMTTRAAIDRLRSARAVREVYTGPWLPEPVISDDDHGPAAVAELDESLTLGYLHLMEQLTPLERAAHLLHDVYDFSYREIADMVGKSEVNCRQLASRARTKLKASRPDRMEARPAAVESDVAERLVAAVTKGDVDSVMALLTDDVVHIIDGGPERRAARRPVVGTDRVARLLVNLAARLDDAPGAVGVHRLDVNLQPGILVTVDDDPLYVVILDVVGDRIHHLYTVLNPAKLHALREL